MVDSFGTHCGVRVLIRDTLEPIVLKREIVS